MPTTTINISLPETLKGEVEAIIAKDGYGNVSEFFRDLIRNHIKDREQARIDALLIEGLQSGPSTPMTKADFDNIRARGLERLRKEK